MRDLVHLLVALPTVKPEDHYRASVAFREVAPMIQSGRKPDLNTEYRLWQLIEDGDESIVQMAAEALFYSGADEEGFAIRMVAVSRVMEAA